LFTQYGPQLPPGQSVITWHVPDHGADNTHTPSSTPFSQSALP